MSLKYEIDMNSCPSHQTLFVISLEKGWWSIGNVGEFFLFGTWIVHSLQSPAVKLVCQKIEESFKKNILRGLLQTTEPVNFRMQFLPLSIVYRNL